ncbi:MAG: hypothetical protein V2B15_16480 [Bacteroidota bacterium]
MYRNHFASSLSSEKARHHFSTSGNTLGIRNTNFIWDRKRQQLVLIIETDQMISQDMNVLLKDDRIILEAPVVTSINKPIRAHLVGQKNSDDYEEDLVVIGFSEVKLKPGYLYHLISRQAVNPKMLKVILGIKPWKKNNNSN